MALLDFVSTLLARTLVRFPKNADMLHLSKNYLHIHLLAHAFAISPPTLSTVSI